MADGQHSGLPAADRDKREESLFKALGSSATALRLARAYIKCKNEELQAQGSKFDVDDYLQVYKQRSSSTVACSPGELSIIQTVREITMNELLSKDLMFGIEISAFVLTMDYFAPGDIPLGMMSSLESNKQKLERIVQTLEQYSLLKWNRDTGMLIIDDRIRQSNVRSMGDDEGFLPQALKAVQDTDSTTIHHALAVWNRVVRCERRPNEFHQLSTHIVVVLLDLGDYDTAASFGRRALEIAGDALACDHPCLHQLAHVVLNIPRSKETTEGKLRVIEASKLSARQQPERIAEFLTLQHRLAFRMCCDTKRALEVLKEVHDKRAAILGPRHRETLLTKGHIARIQYSLDHSKCDESFKVLADVVEAIGDGTAADCEEIADIRRCLAQLLTDKREFDEALTKLQKFQDACQKVLGPGHDATLRLVEDIIMILTRKGEHREALEVCTKLRKLQEESLGYDDHKLLITLGWIKQIRAALGNSSGHQFMRELFLSGTFFEALLLFGEGRLFDVLDLLYMIDHSGLPESSSMRLLVIALRAKLQAMGDVHRGSVYFGRPNMNESTRFAECLSSLMRHHDKDRVDEFRLHYARVLELLGGDEHDACRRALISSLVSERSNSAFDDVIRLKAQFERAKTLRDAEMFEESLSIFEQVFAKQKESLGPDDVVTLNTRHEMAGVLSKLNRHKEAIEHYRYLYEKSKQLFGPGHICTAEAQLNLARLFAAQENYQEALDMSRSVFDETVAKLGLDDQRILKIQHRIAYCLSRQGNHLAALALFKNVHLAQRKVLGASHPDTLLTKGHLETCESRLKQDPGCSQGIDRALSDYVASKTIDLHRSINDGDVEAVKNLLRESVDITQAATDRGWTPLHTATLRGNTQMVAMLVAQAEQRYDTKKFDDLLNARTTSGRNTALHLAAESGHLEIVVFLLKYRAIYELKNEQGKKPADVATTHEIGKLLRVIDKLFMGAQRGARGVVDVVEGLCGEMIRAVFNTRNIRNQKLLDVAQSNKHTHLVKELSECYEEKTTGRCTPGSSCGLPRH